MDVKSVDSLEAARDLSASGLTSVLVEVTECYPAKDARELLGVLEDNVKRGSWLVSAESLEQLKTLADACDNLKDADTDIVGIIDGATNDLLPYVNDGPLTVAGVPLNSASRRAIVSQVLGLPVETKPPRRFTPDNLQHIANAYQLLQEQIDNSRMDLESIRTHLRDVWRPWAEERLNARVTLGEPFFDSS